MWTRAETAEAAILGLSLLMPGCSKTEQTTARDTLGFPARIVLPAVPETVPAPGPQYYSSDSRLSGPAPNSTFACTFSISGPRGLPTFIEEHLPSCSLTCFEASVY